MERETHKSRKRKAKKKCWKIPGRRELTKRNNDPGGGVGKRPRRFSGTKEKNPGGPDQRKNQTTQRKGREEEGKLLRDRQRRGHKKKKEYSGTSAVVPQHLRAWRGNRQKGSNFRRPIKKIRNKLRSRIIEIVTGGKTKQRQRGEKQHRKSDFVCWTKQKPPTV